MKKRRLFFFYLFLFVSKSVAEYIKTYPPSGYESILAAREAPVDIYYGGHYRATVLAVYDLESISFLNPADVVKVIPDITTPELVLDILSQPLDIHADLVCGQSYSPRCGRLAPEVTGVIFDESSFKVLLFINPVYLEQAEKISDRYLPSSDASQPGLLQGINLTVAGAQGESAYTSWSVQGNTLAGWQENRLEGTWNLGKNRSGVINSLFAAHEFAGRQYSGGYLSSPYSFSRFTYSRRMLGFQLGSSMNTLADAGYLRTSPLEIFMPEDGQVEVYRDEQLISTQQLQSGNRLIDTRSFAGGTYDLELVGRSQAGQELFRERRLYVKRNRLPVNGFHDYFLEVGEMTYPGSAGLPEQTHNLIVRGGWQQGVGVQTGIYSAMAATDKEQVFELGLGHSLQDIWLEAGCMAGGQDQYGLMLLSELEFSSFRLQSEIKQAWHLPQEKAQEKAGSTKRSLSGQERDQYLTGVERKHFSCSVNRHIWRGNASLRYSEREEKTRRHHAATLSYFATVFRGGADSLGLGFEISRSSDDIAVRCTLNWYYSELDWSHGVSSGYSRNKPVSGKARTSSELGLNSSWNNYDPYRMANLSWSMGARFRDESRTAEGRVAYGGEPGSGNIYFVHHEDKNTSGSVYALNLHTSMTLDQRGIAMGGAEQGGGNSAVVVIVNGVPSSERFQVLINNYPRAFANGGDQVAVPLPAFNSYTIGLRPVGNSVYDGIERVETITLYPGNVKTMTFDLWTRKVIIGRLLTPDGKVLAGTCGEYGQTTVCSDQQGCSRRKAGEIIA